MADISRGVSYMCFTVVYLNIIDLRVKDDTIRPSKGKGSENLFLWNTLTSQQEVCLQVNRDIFNHNATIFKQVNIILTHLHNFTPFMLLNTLLSIHMYYSIHIY